MTRTFEGRRKVLELALAACCWTRGLEPTKKLPPLCETHFEDFVRQRERLPRVDVLWRSKAHRPLDVIVPWNTQMELKALDRMSLDTKGSGCDVQNRRKLAQLPRRDLP